MRKAFSWWVPHHLSHAEKTGKVHNASTILSKFGSEDQKCITDVMTGREVIFFLSSTTQGAKHGLDWRKWWPTRIFWGRISFTKTNVHGVPQLNWPWICCYGAQRSECECNLLYRNSPRIRAEKSRGKEAHMPCLRKSQPATWQRLMSHCCLNSLFVIIFWSRTGFNSLTILLKPLTWPFVTFGYSQNGQKTCWGKVL